MRVEKGIQIGGHQEMGTNRVFTMAFKRDAAQLVLDGGYNVREAYETVGVGETAMRRWVKELQAEREATGIVVGSERTTGKQRTREMEVKMVGLLGEISNLKREVARLKEDKHILKKASALLMLNGRGSDEWSRQ